MIISVEVPDSFDDLSDFTPAELAELRKLLTAKVFLKLESRIESNKPKNYIAGQYDALTMERSAMRLAEIRGWDARRAAIFIAVNPQPKREPTEEKFQPAGIH